MKIPSHYECFPTCSNGSFGVHNKHDPWRQLVKVYFCPCQDGKKRTVKITGQPDTYFSIPGSINVKGKEVSGFVGTDDDGYYFRAYTYRKNWPIMEKAIEDAFAQIEDKKRFPSLGTT